MSGVGLILTKLHSGGKFSNKNYQFSGGLHGVGVSVVNALSTKLEVDIKRDAKQFNITFGDGKLKSKLKQTGTVGQRNTGTAVRFWPDKQYFDSVKFSIRRCTMCCERKPCSAQVYALLFTMSKVARRKSGFMKMA